MTTIDERPQSAVARPWAPMGKVELASWEYAHASDVGIRRFTANWGKQDASYYDKNRMEDDRTAQVAAAVSELAVAKFTNRFWSGTVWDAADHARYRDLPDVGRNIEVRRVRTGETAAVRRKQLGKGLVLWVARPVPPEFRLVELWGWLPYDEAWDLAEDSPASYDKAGNTRLVHRSLLRQVMP